MKRAKRIYILLGVLAVVCIAAFAVMQYQEQQEIIQNTDEIILEVDAGTVQSLSWEYESETLAFHKDGTWLYDEDEAFPVDEEKMNALLELFQDFGASFIIHDVTDFAQYGLDDPVCTIDLTTEDTSYEIQLGDYSTMDAQRYVSIGDGNVYLVQDDPLDTFDVELSDLIDNDETPIFDQVESIQFTGSDSYQVIYQAENTYSYCADDVYFKEQDGTYLPLDTSLVDSYLSTITSLGLTDYVTYNAAEEDLATYHRQRPQRHPRGNACPLRPEQGPDYVPVPGAAPGRKRRLQRRVPRVQGHVGAGGLRSGYLRSGFPGYRHQKGR